MDDINSALEKIVTLNGNLTKLDKDVVRHNSNFGEFHYNITESVPNPVTSRVLTRDIIKLRTRVRMYQKNEREKNSRKTTYQGLFLSNIYRSLSAQEAFIDYFFNPQSEQSIRGFLHHYFEQPYSVVEKKVRNKKFYEEDNRKQKLSKFFSDYEFSSSEKETLKISECMLPEIKKFLLSFAKTQGLIDKDVDFDIVIEKEDKSSSWHEGVLSLDIGSFRYTRNNGKIELHLAKALRDSTHEFIGHGLHQMNSKMLSESIIPCATNSYGLIFKVLEEGISDYWESKVLNYLRRSKNKIEISVCESAPLILKTSSRVVSGNDHRYIKIGREDLEYVGLEYKLGPFWNCLDFIEHTNEMEKPLSEQRQKTARQTRNFCLVRDIWHSRNGKYSSTLFDYMPVVFGGPYTRKTISRVRSEYGIPLKFAEKVSMIGAWSTKVHYLFVELLLDALGYKKKKVTKKSQ